MKRQEQRAGIVQSANGSRGPSRSSMRLADRPFAAAQHSLPGTTWIER